MLPGVHGGNPVSKIKDLDPEFILEKPESYIDYEFDIELLRKYLPKWVGFEKEMFSKRGVTTSIARKEIRT